MEARNMLSNKADAFDENSSGLSNGIRRINRHEQSSNSVVEVCDNCLEMDKKFKL